MTLDEGAILAILEKPANSSLATWKTDHDALDIYVNGGNVSAELERVKNYENEAQKQLRDKIARSTKDLLGYILKPTSKVFTASGSVVDITGKSEDEFREYMSRLPEGMSVRKWMRTYWMEAYVTDPNGIILVESSKDGSESYPTYKNINVIHDYTHTWGKLDYLVLLHKMAEVGDAEKQIYRVIDHEKDALYYIDDSKDKTVLGRYETEDEKHSVPNILKKIPAVIVSDLVDRKTYGRRSFIFPITELLKEYMRDSSVHSIYKFLHGFPIFWSYAMKCTTCEGAGKIKNYNWKEGDPVADKKVVCPTCNGKRLKVTNDVSDGVRLPLPNKGEDPILAPNVAGYIQPDLKTWKAQQDTLKAMARDMHFATWGTHVEDEKSNTATGRYIDAQPVNDVLREIAETAQKKEEKILEYIAELQFKGIDKLSVTYGKTYIIETPDILWEKYVEAKDHKAPVSVLDTMYKRFLEGEHAGDSIMLDRKLKEIKLEPFPHFGLSDLKGVASSKQLQSKILFNSWISTPDIEWSKTLEDLKSDFDEYLNTHTDETIPEVPSPSGEGEGSE